MEFGTSSQADAVVRSSSPTSGSDGSVMNQDDGCSRKTLINMMCSMDRDESGKPVRVCEKTKEVLKLCRGRPAEVVESSTSKVVEELSTSLSDPFTEDDTVGRGTSFLRGFERKNSVDELVQAAEDIFGDFFSLSGRRQAPNRQDWSLGSERPRGSLWGKCGVDIGEIF